MAGEVVAALGDALEIVIDGGPSPGGIASTVIDCAATRPRLIRSGAIIPERLAEELDARGLAHELSRP
jgi:tRNA A37 threonylcarbamoyladenosine synthetase subunit TsaC/SUA5/YrdC